jgi:hypothetical protein
MQDIERQQRRKAAALQFVDDLDLASDMPAALRQTSDEKCRQPDAGTCADSGDE